MHIQEYSYNVYWQIMSKATCDGLSVDTRSNRVQEANNMDSIQTDRLKNIKV